MASSSITSWQINGETMETVTDFIFLDSKITADGDCSHKIKRCLLLAVPGTFKNLLQHHSSKASVLWHSVFFMVQLSHSYMTTGKTIPLTVWTFVSKVMSLLFNILSWLVITFLPRSKHLLILWLQSPSSAILEPKRKSMSPFPLFPHQFAIK